jgi:hypothetical protein
MRTARAHAAPVAASQEPASASAITAIVRPPPNAREHNQCGRRVAAVDVEHVDQAGEIKLRQRYGNGAGGA